MGKPAAKQGDQVIAVDVHDGAIPGRTGTYPLATSLFREAGWRLEPGCLHHGHACSHGGQHRQ